MVEALCLVPEERRSLWPTVRLLEYSVWAGVDLDAWIVLRNVLDREGRGHEDIGHKIGCLEETLVGCLGYMRCKL